MRSLRVVVTDPIIGRFAESLTSGHTDGHAWSMVDGWEAGEVLAALSNADVVLCSRLSAEQAAACQKATLVQVAGAGYDRITVDSLPVGVTIANTYHHGHSIAEHVLMVTMMLSRHVLRADRDLRNGTWRSIATDTSAPFGATLSGRVLGLVGIGEIGGHVARLASSFQMRVRAVRSNPAVPTSPDLDLDWVGGDAELLELASASDVMVVTAPLSERTRGMIGAPVFAAMPSTALLVNVARGPVVDEEALYRALVDGSIAGAGIDVWWDGTGTGRPSRWPFTGLDNVVLTPHQSGHTIGTFEGRARDIAANVDAVAHGRPLRNVVRR